MLVFGWRGWRLIVMVQLQYLLSVQFCKAITNYVSSFQAPKDIFHLPLCMWVTLRSS